MFFFDKLINLMYHNYDFEKICNSNVIYLVYFLFFTIIFLENSILLAAFLPSDSLLIFIGILSAKNYINFYKIIFLLVIASSLGSWVSYLQGKWLSSNKLVKKWLYCFFPKYYYFRACCMLHNYGLFAMLIGRFIIFVRTLLPIIIGLSELSSIRFHIFNWISSFFWVFFLIIIGFVFGKSAIFQYYEQIFINFFTLTQIFLLTVGIIGLFFIVYKKVV